MTPHVLILKTGHIGKIRIIHDLCALIHLNSVRAVAIKTCACNCVVYTYLLMWEKQFDYVKIMPLW